MGKDTKTNKNSYKTIKNGLLESIEIDSKEKAKEEKEEEKERKEGGAQDSSKTSEYDEYDDILDIRAGKFYYI